jgi:hypothetical protein
MHYTELKRTKMRINSVDLIKRVKAKKVQSKKNFTFRLSPDLVSQFQKVCEKQDCTATAVIEEFMTEFVKDMDSGKR